MEHDTRIGHAFLRAGIGYGGSCFPKDVDAFAHLAAAVGAPFPLLDEVRAIDEGQRQYVLDLLVEELWHLSGKRIALLGAAFKPDTDDLREAPPCGSRSACARMAPRSGCPTRRPSRAQGVAAGRARTR